MEVNHTDEILNISVSFSRMHISEYADPPQWTVRWSLVYNAQEYDFFPQSMCGYMGGCNSYIGAVTRSIGAVFRRLEAPLGTSIGAVFRTTEAPLGA